MKRRRHLSTGWAQPVEKRPTSRSRPWVRAGHAARSPLSRRVEVSRWKAPWVQPRALFFAEERSKRPSAGGPAQAGPSGGELRESRLAGRGASAPSSGGLVKAHGRTRLRSGLSGSRLDDHHDGNAGLFSRWNHERTTEGVRGRLESGSAPLRREKSRRDGARRGESQATEPLIDKAPATPPRRRRTYPETTSGEGNLTTARVTSRHVRSGLRPLLATTISRGSLDPRPCSRIVFDCSAGTHRFRMSIFRDRCRRAPRKQGDAAERSLGRSPRASEGRASMGPHAVPDLGPSPVRDGERRIEADRPGALDRAGRGL
jgi:hypothetical protein